MNEEQIETLLRKAPSPTAPAGLAERLKQQIKLPHASAQTNRVRQFELRRGLMRWLPAFSVAAFFLACVVAIGVQTGVLTGLRHENENLRATVGNLDQLRAENEEYKRLQAMSAELDQLRKDHDDLLRLRNELAQLRAGAQETEKLRADNQELQSNNAALQVHQTPGGDPLDAAIQKEKDQAERATCANHLKQIGLAAKMFEDDHGYYPRRFSDFAPVAAAAASNSDGSFLTNIVYSEGRPASTNIIRLAPGERFRAGFDQPDSMLWKLFQCPSETSPTLTGWPDVAAGKSSYVFAPQGRKGGYPDSEIVFMYCPIHHVYLLQDGSVQLPTPESEQKFLKQVDGWTLILRQ